MKLTTKQLKQMIQEEIEKITETDPNAEDQKPFVKHFLHLLINGETRRPFTPEEIDAMDTSAIDDLADQMRDALRRSGAKRIPPLSDPGAFDPHKG